MTIKEQISRLEKLIADYNTQEILESMIFYHFIGPEELRFSINELICGLAVKRSVTDSKYIYNFKEYNKIIERAKRIFNKKAVEKLELGIAHKDDSLEEKKKFEQSFFAESKYLFLRGEAYINQLLEFSGALYKRLQQEFQEIFGFTYKDVEKIFIYSFQRYVRNVEKIDIEIEKISNTITFDDFIQGEIPPALINIKFIELMNGVDFQISLAELYKIVNKEACDNVIKRLGTKIGDINTKFNDLTGFNELNARPIIVLDNDKIIFPIIINSMMNFPKLFHYDFLGLDKTLYDKKRGKEIKGHYGEVRGDVIEDLSTNYLSRIFYKKNIYNSLKYGRKFNDEADITITYKEIVVLIECKGKLMTLVALQGNYDKIKSDFKLAVQKAYDQGCRTQKHIMEDGDFKDKDGNVFKIDKPRKFIKICIVSDYLGHLGTNPELLQLDDEYPLVLNIYDLDYITKNVKNRQQFIEYIEFRLSNPQIQNMDELELFNYFINNKGTALDISEADIIIPIDQMFETDIENEMESYEYIMNYKI